MMSEREAAVTDDRRRSTTSPTLTYRPTVSASRHRTTHDGFFRSQLAMHRSTSPGARDRPWSHSIQMVFCSTIPRRCWP